MKAETVIEVVKKLVGEVDAAGSSHIDEKRLENLKVMTEVIDELIREVIYSASTKDDYRYSMQQIGKYAFGYLKEWKETLDEITGEEDEETEEDEDPEEWDDYNLDLNFDNWRESHGTD